MTDADRTDHLGSLLRRLIDEATARAWQGTISVATEKFAEELARDAMREPLFREQWRAAVREASQRMLDALNHRPATRRRAKARPRRRV